MFLKNYSIDDLIKDIPAGMIVALISIPISISYAMIAGLPPVYGLYGSLFPILVYGLLTTSTRFVFGVDAAPAALVGGFLQTMGIAAQSQEAVQIVPVFTLLTAVWLLIFRLAGMGRFVKYISMPVMGGLISGIVCTIILMQVPRLFGGTAGHGEVIELVEHIVHEAEVDFNGLSLVLGVGTAVLILLSNRFFPKAPVSVLAMVIGAMLTELFHIDRYGVKLLPHVERGLPHFSLPDLSLIEGNARYMIFSSMIVAFVIIAETLMATNEYALRYGEKVDNDHEILAYAIGNFAAAFTGCCPVNGSASMSGIVDRFGVRSQGMSIVAFLSMLMVLLFGTDIIRWLPMPVVTGIVIAALTNCLEFGIAKKLRKVDRVEWTVFFIVFFMVLFLGKIYGIIGGVILSFVVVITRESDPPRTRLGCIPGKDGFYPVGRTGAREIRGALIYRFSGPLFFANAGRLHDDIDDELERDPSVRTVVIDASGITSIDVSAVERLLIMYRALREKNIRFFLTEHTSEVNDQLRGLGAMEMFRDGAIRPTIEDALASAGFTEPYDLNVDEGTAAFGKDAAPGTAARKINERRVGRSQLAEFEWAYGSDADDMMRAFAAELAVKIADSGGLDSGTLAATERDFFGENWSGLDEEKFLDFLEVQIALLRDSGKIEKDTYEIVNDELLRYHARLDAELDGRDAGMLGRIVEKRHEREQRIRERDPKLYEVLLNERRRHREILKVVSPSLYERLQELRSELEDPDENI